MRSFLAVSALAAAAAFFPASAQTYADGSRVLIDPGTGQTRVVGPLLMPGEEATPVRLRPPVKHRKTPPSDETQLTEVEPPPLAPPPRRPAPRLQPPKPALQTPQPAAAPPPTRTASLEAPAPFEQRPAGGKVKGVIKFAANASDPTTTAVAALRALAAELSTALLDARGRIEIRAYAGERGEKTSLTRRLSLKRALIVRQLLIDDGLPAERIDVFALGGVEDDGATDRVDILVSN